MIPPADFQQTYEVEIAYYHTDPDLSSDGELLLVGCSIVSRTQGWP